MAVHASHAALPYPIKGARFSMLVPLLDADGDPTAQTTPDTEISEDNAAATDAAEEVSATSGMDGMGLITFTGAETDCSSLAVAFKAASGPKTTLATLYPRVLASVGTGTLSAGSAGGGTLGTVLPYDITGCFIKTTGGTGGGGTGGANNQVRRIITYNTSTGAFTVAPDWETTPSTDTTYDILLPDGVTLGMLRALNPTTAGRTLTVESDGMGHADLKEWLGVAPLALTSQLVQTSVGALQAAVITATSIASDAITAAKIATDAITSAKIADGALTAAKFASGAFDAVWSVTTRILTAATNITSTGGTTVPQTGDNYARLGAPAGASVSADIAAVKTDTGNLVTRITSTLFMGITSLAEWLGLIAGKQTGNTTARTELRATGAGSGTYDETTDSQEALRDRGDAAWTTATGFSTHSAADVWAVGTRTLTSFGTLTTDVATAVWAAGTRTLSAFDASFKTGYALSSAGVQAIWDALTSALTTVGSIGKLLVDNVNATIGSRASQTSVDDLPTNAELATALASADDAVLAAIAALNNLSAAQVLTQVNAALDAALADSIPADGSLPSIRQAVYMGLQFLVERTVSGTTVTIKKVDGSTTLFTCTLDDATTPTSITRAT